MGSIWKRRWRDWWRRFPRRPAKQPPKEPPPQLGDSAAAHAGDDPEPLHRGRRRLKESYTNHWDLDYLPRDEVEKIVTDLNKKR
ncbi:hypothetical protein [Alloalcanivorax mobilis]|uniref:hypothetical protein n=1 Tax=Alloalcanivorax mobilis TaxID=2019569 RepID=UPI000B5B334D|nr:hypothetical protein [Alloalcanivorax mobilis]ASK35731.1 hypothetical protein CEK62_15745 [Alcanivorax sp. N3-2A]|tara:strand:- start:18912 stop:19163 length:252 start_codon:yes stop_codon:yes gene_type:complete